MQIDIGIEIEFWIQIRRSQRSIDYNREQSAITCHPSTTTHPSYSSHPLFPLSIDIRKFFNLTKEDDVRKFVIRREVQPKKEGAKPYTKAPKIQRLITSQRLQRQRHLRSLKKRKTEVQRDQKKEYDQVVAKRTAEKKERSSIARAAKKASRA